jgi:hypothetical protein
MLQTAKRFKNLKNRGWFKLSYLISNAAVKNGR